MRVLRASVGRKPVFRHGVGGATGMSGLSGLPGAPAGPAGPPGSFPVWRPASRRRVRRRGVGRDRRRGVGRVRRRGVGRVRRRGVGRVRRRGVGRVRRRGVGRVRRRGVGRVRRRGVGPTTPLTGTVLVVGPHCRRRTPRPDQPSSSRSTRPVRGLGQKNVVLGGMRAPPRPIAAICSTVTGRRRMAASAWPAATAAAALSHPC